MFQHNLLCNIMKDMAIIGHSVLASWYSSVFLSEIFIAFHCLVFLKDSIPLLKRGYLVICILICQSLSTKLLKLYHTNPRVGVIDQHIPTPCPYSLLSFAKLSLKFQSISSKFLFKLRLRLALFPAIPARYSTPTQNSSF